MAQAPLVKGQDSVFVGVRFGAPLARAMDELAESTGSSRSALIRQAMKNLVEGEQREVEAA